MTIEEMVVSLDLAKELKASGYPQEDALFYWSQLGKDWIINLSVFTMEPQFAAPTASEIGQVLPAKITDLNYELFISNGCGEKSDEWCVFYSDFMEMTAIQTETYDSNEANARAKMWLYLKENNLLGGTE